MILIRGHFFKSKTCAPSNQLSVLRVTERGVGFKGRSRHDRNRHNRHNRHNRQNRHGRLFVLYFVGPAKRGQGALQNRQTRQNRQNRHEGYPP